MITMLGLVALVAGACSSSDGRQLRAPDVPVTTQVPRISTPATQPAAGSFSITSPNFVDLGILPDAFSSKGAGISPQLDWFNVPQETGELAIVMTDITTNGTVHWIIWGLDPSRIQLLAAEVPPGARQSINYLGSIGWAPPDPPGNGFHTYVFEIHAIAGGIAAPDGATPAEVMEQIRELSLASTQIAGLVE